MFREEDAGGVQSSCAMVLVFLFPGSYGVRDGKDDTGGGQTDGLYEELHV